jgi:hypothetical protein
VWAEIMSAYSGAVLGYQSCYVQTVESGVGLGQIPITGAQMDRAVKHAASMKKKFQVPAGSLLIKS